MRTISKCLFIGLCAATMLSCASSKQNMKTAEEQSYGEVAPRLLHDVRPEFPAEAEANGITGTVWMQVLIDTLGVIQEAKVIPDKGENIEVFKESAMKAAFKAKWVPAKSGGKPIAVWVTYKIKFSYK